MSGAAVWTTLTAHVGNMQNTGRDVMNRPVEAHKPSATEKQEAAAQAVREFWRAELRLPPTYDLEDDSVMLVWLGDSTMHKIKPHMSVSYPVRDDNPAKLYVFYVTQMAVANTMNIYLLGMATREALADTKRKVRVQDLIRQSDFGYEAWRDTFPRAELIEEAVVDEEGNVVRREVWGYPGDRPGMPQNQVPVMPLARCIRLLPSSALNEHALIKRGVEFVAAASWNPGWGDDDRFPVWDEEAKGGDKRHPEALQGMPQLHFARAFVACGMAAAVWPVYSAVRESVEASYLRWLMRRHRFLEDEIACVTMLQRNGLQDWLLELVDEHDVELFRQLHPERPEPKFCGWAPLGEVPVAFYTEQGRPIRAGAVRVFYSDVQDMVLHQMRLDQLRFNSLTRHRQEELLTWSSPEAQTIQNMWMLAGADMVQRQYRVLGRGPRMGGSNTGAITNSRELDLTPEELVLAMPPCMRRMISNAQQAARHLRDGERQWFARFLQDLGFSVGMYEKLVRPHWEAEKRRMGERHDDTAWRAAWDVNSNWKKGYAKPTCSAIIKLTMSPKAMYTDQTTKNRVEMPRCECPYAGHTQFHNPGRDPDAIEELTRRSCLDEWKRTNPDKVRENEKKLYYPSQHVYLNLRGRGRHREYVEIAYEQE